MNQVRFLTALFTIALPVSSGIAAPQAASKSEELTRQSSLIFSGTVKKTNASNVPTVPASPSTAVVHVDEVTHNAGVVADLAGKDVTVELAAGASVKAKQQAVFYTNIDVYGDTIAVREVGHEPVAPGGTAALRAQATNLTDRAADEKLQKRIAQADLVVAGKVVSVRPHGAPKRVPPSEHDPEWREATIQVSSTAKGQAPAELVVVFPNSTDIRWIGTPKFKANDEGVFMLHRTDDDKLQVHGFTALDALDFQPMAQLDRVRRLAQTAR
jgi:hypothetical protein